MRTRAAGARSAVFVGLAVLLASSGAEAAIVRGDAGTMTIAIAGTLGGITTSISAAVYAADGRAFDSGWILASLLSAGVCASISGAMAKNVASDGGGAPAVTGFLFFAALAAWPAYWSIKTALADVDPGETFEASVIASRSAIDPFARIDPRPQPSFAIAFPVLALPF